MKASKSTPESIDDYIRAFPPKIQSILKNIRLTIRQAAPHAAEKISYRMPAFFQNGALAYYAAFKNHIGFFPPVPDDAKLQKAAAPFASPNGNLRFPIDQPIPYDLIKRIVKHRLGQNDAKIASRTTKTRSRKGPH